MSTKHRQRGIRLMMVLVALFAALGLIVFALSKNLHLFYTPTEVASHTITLPPAFRMGGMVLEHSVHQKGLEVEFKITDYANEVSVVYHGILPDLFREGQGIVVLGSYDSDKAVLKATQVLAKHDENYMPIEAKKALQASRMAKDQAVGDKP